MIIQNLFWCGRYCWWPLTHNATDAGAKWNHTTLYDAPSVNSRPYLTRTIRLEYIWHALLIIYEFIIRSNFAFRAQPVSATITTIRLGQEKCAMRSRTEAKISFRQMLSWPRWSRESSVIATCARMRAQCAPPGCRRWMSKVKRPVYAYSEITSHCIAYSQLKTLKKTYVNCRRFIYSRLVQPKHHEMAGNHKIETLNFTNKNIFALAKTWKKRLICERIRICAWPSSFGRFGVDARWVTIPAARPRRAVILCILVAVKRKKRTIGSEKTSLAEKFHTFKRYARSRLETSRLGCWRLRGNVLPFCAMRARARRRKGARKHK